MRLSSIVSTGSVWPAAATTRLRGPQPWITMSPRAAIRAAASWRPGSRQICPPAGGRRSIAACRSSTAPWLLWPSPTWIVQQVSTSHSLRKRWRQSSTVAVLPLAPTVQCTRPSGRMEALRPHRRRCVQEPPGHHEVRRVRPHGDDPEVARQTEVGEAQLEPGPGQWRRRARLERMIQIRRALGSRLPDPGVEVAPLVDRVARAEDRIARGRLQPFLHLRRDRRRDAHEVAARIVGRRDPREVARGCRDLLAVRQHRVPRQDLDDRALQRKQHRIARRGHELDRDRAVRRGRRVLDLHPVQRLAVVIRPKETVGGREAGSGSPGSRRRDSRRGRAAGRGLR